MSSETKTASTTTTATADRFVDETPEIQARPMVALITGITGQDGSYLAEFLLEKGYEVHGIIRRSSSFNTGRIDHLYIDKHQSNAKFFLHYGDLADSTNLISTFRKIRPAEVYNLAAQSHVKVSFSLPEYTANIDGLGTLRLLDAIRTCGLTKSTRFYQASTSELYGKVQEIPQSETTPFYPRSPYAVAKQYAYWIIVNYREAYGMYCCNGILFNHESPRRGPTFVTRKTTRAVAKIAAGEQECLYLGNMDSKRDWGHAKDYIKAMWMMLQAEAPDDFVVATGEMHTVREFVTAAFTAAGKTITWSGVGVEEQGTDEKGNVVVRVDPAYFRPTEVDLLLGDPTKIKTKLGWSTEIGFDELVTDMVTSDMSTIGATTLKF